jgi:hypothetical protein
MTAAQVEERGRAPVPPVYMHLVFVIFVAGESSARRGSRVRAMDVGRPQAPQQHHA